MYPCALRRTEASPYVTVLGAWALTEAREGEDAESSETRVAALAWLRRQLGNPASELSRVEGLAEQAITVLAWADPDDAATRALVRGRLETTLAECALHPTADGPRCERGPGRVGESWLDHQEGPGPNLVTFWFPWTVLLTHTASGPALGLDAELRGAVRSVLDANLGRVREGLDMLEAAPTYELAEFLVMVSRLVEPR